MDPARQFFPSSGRKVDSWPEVVGLKAQEATRIIERDMPDAWVQLVPEGFAIMMNISRKRVRLFLDSEERVRLVPKVG